MRPRHLSYALIVAFVFVLIGLAQESVKPAIRSVKSDTSGDGAAGAQSPTTHTIPPPMANKQSESKPDDWERRSWIATTIGFGVTALGLAAVVIQLGLQRRQSRLEFLEHLYSELDTHEARLGRQRIYEAAPQDLTFTAVHAKGREEWRQIVEGTLATFERLAYPILQRQVPSEDAFNLYGGVLLSIAYQLWPYVEEQRARRKASGLRHRLGYRRFLEAVIHEWAPKYARAAGLPPLARNLKTLELLRQLFPNAPTTA